MENILSVEEAVSEYSALLYSVAYGILRSREDAEDAVADAFSAYCENHPKFDPGRSSLKTYLVVLTRNAAIDRARARKRRYTEPLDAFIELGGEDDTEISAVDSINADLIRDAVISLGVPDGEIFTRRYYYCQTVKQIARSMGLKAKFVESRLYRAKDKLRKYLLDGGINL